MEQRLLLSVVSDDQPGVMQFDHIVYGPAAQAAAALAAGGAAASGAAGSAPAAAPAGSALPGGAGGGTMAADDMAPLSSSSPIGFTPTQIRTAYGVSQLSVGTNGGAGQTIALIDVYDDPNLVSSTHPSSDTAFAASDFGKFDAAMGLPDPPSFLKVNEYGNTSPLPAASGSSGWSVEESLDVEWAHAMAPAANIILIEVSSASDADLISTPMASLGTAASLANVSVVSMSFGRSESSSDSSLNSAFTTPAGHTPITYLASTGDDGAPGGFPAFSPNVVAVGGTTLTLGAGNAWASETGWSWNSTYLWGTGGGRSSYEAEPSYQQSVQTSGWRETPDVSFLADPLTGVTVYDSYDYGSAAPWEQVGGTSLSSPCWAGLIAIADQLRISASLPDLDGRQGTLPALYKLPAADFHDITAGSNNGYSAGPGYDMVTGIGTPKANLLVPDLVGITSKGTVAFAAHAYEIGTSATATVSDLDLLGNSFCPVTFASSAGDSETANLPAVGGGVFTGSILTSAAAVVAGDGILETAPGGTITVTYNDANDGTGHPAVVTDTATTYRVDHYTFTTVSSPQTEGVPFSVTATACDAGNNPLTAYNGTAALTAVGAGGALSITPASVTFASGVWTGSVTVNAVDSSATLSLNNGNGAVGTSNVFAAQAGPLASFQWSTIAATKFQSVPFPVTLTAKDAHGYTVTGFNGTATLSGAVGSTTTGMILGEPTPDWSGNYGTFTIGYSFTPSATITVTDVLHYFGSKISIWTDSGTLVASQTYPLAGPGWLDTPLTTPVQLTGGTTYRIAAYSAGQTYYRWTSASHASPLGTLGQEYEISGDAFPTNSVSDDWWTVDLLAQVGTFTNVPITPTTAAFVNGTWTGNVTVLQAANNMRLHVADGSGHVGDSNTFSTTNLPPLSLVTPSDAREGMGVVGGAVSIPLALAGDLTVSLASSDPSRLTVPASVTIPAGRLSAPLPITIIDDSLLNGPEVVSITAAAAGYTNGAATVMVHDNETATLAVSLPASAHETAGSISGTITASAAPAANFTLSLTSSDGTRLTVPATVTLPAGQTTVPFTAMLLDDHVIEGGPTPVTVTAATENWTSGSATVNILDDDATMGLTLPASGWEGQTASGTVTIGGTLGSPLVVSLLSGTPTQLSVPATVTIPAGSRTAGFTATLLDNGLKTGPQTVQVTASASGLPPAATSMVVDDADVDHYTFSTISSPQVAGLPFTVTITACDVLNNVIAVYNGAVPLVATGSGGSLPVSPASVTFASGVWTGSVTVNAVDLAAVLQLNNGAGAAGTSNVFATKSQLHVVSTTPGAGGMFDLPGPLSYTVNFSEPVAAASVTSGALSLSGITGAAVSGVTVLAGDTAAQFTLSGITVEGTLTATLAAGAISDAYGFPIAAFSASYFVDQANPMQPASFTALAPAGSTIFESQGNSAMLSGAADRDDYAFFVQAGQTVSAVATPTAPGVTLSLALDSGAPVAGTAGQPVTLAPQYISADGVQTLHVSGSGASAFTLNIYRNATLESLAGNSSSSNSMAIDNSAIAVPGGPLLGPLGTRYAVVGASAPTVGTVARQITTTFAGGNGQNGNMFNVTTLTNPITITSLDLNITSGTYTVALYTRPGTYLGYETTPSAWTQMATGTVAAAGSGSPSPFNVVPNLQLPANTLTGFYVTITNGGILNYTNGSNTYGNSDLQLTLGEGISYPFGSVFTPRTWNGNIHYTVGTGSGTPDVDSYTLNLTGKSGHRLDIVLAGQQGVRFSGEQLQLLGTDGSTVLATAIANPLATGTTVTNYDLGILGFVVPADGVYTIRLTSTTTQGSYAIVVTDSVLFDTEPNDLLTNPLRTLTSSAPALGSVSSSDVDDYLVTLTAGQPMAATTATPFDNAQCLPGNLLVPRLELLTLSGTLLASNQGGASDNRNALLSYTPTASGSYALQVSAASQQGEYVVGLTQLLTLALPANVTKGDGTVNGTLSIPVALGTNLAVALTSSDPTRLTVPASVTVLAGQTSVPLPITAVDDGLLDGPEAVTITAAAAGYVNGAATVMVHDNETATLAVSLPASAHETAGSISGTIIASAAPAANFTLSLTSSDGTRLTVPATVTLPAGQTTVPFSATLLDDHVIEGGPTPVTVTAATENWTNGSATVSILDDDATMGLTLPASGWEGQTASGTVTIGGTLGSPLVVSLLSGTPTQLSVPATVTIPAGSRTAGFTATLLDNGLKTGPQTVQVTTSASGLPPAATSMVVDDADVDHYTFSTISGPQVAGLPFTVTATACDVLNNVIAVYNGTVPLAATGSGGSLPVSPASVTFASGVWTGSVTVNAVDPAAVLQLNNGAGATAASNAFAVQAGPLAGFQWSPIASPQAHGVPFPVTLTAKDANGYTATGFNGTATLSGIVGTGSSSLDSFDQGSSDLSNYTFTSTNNASITAAAAHDGPYGLQLGDTTEWMYRTDAAAHVQQGEELSVWVKSTTNTSGRAYFGFGASATSTLDMALGENTNELLLQDVTGYNGAAVYTVIATVPQSWLANHWYRFDVTWQTGGTIIGRLYDSDGSTLLNTVSGTDNSITSGGIAFRGFGSTKYFDTATVNGTQVVIPVSPASVTFVNGMWTGNVTVTQTATGMHLHADDGSGHVGDSGSFNANVLPVDSAAPVVTGQVLLDGSGPPQIDGSVDDPAATVQVTVDGQVYAAVNHGDGTWALPPGTIPGPLDPAACGVTVAATDPAGETSTAVILSAADPQAGGVAVSGVLVLAGRGALPPGTLLVIACGGSLVLGDSGAPELPLAAPQSAVGSSLAAQPATVTAAAAQSTPVAAAAKPATAIAAMVQPVPVAALAAVVAAAAPPVATPASAAVVAGTASVAPPAVPRAASPAPATASRATVTVVVAAAVSAPLATAAVRSGAGCGDLLAATPVQATPPQAEPAAALLAGSRNRALDTALRTDHTSLEAIDGRLLSELAAFLATSPPAKHSLLKAKRADALFARL
jgi:methionine-rich copper-binding protein CopC